MLKAVLDRIDLPPFNEIPRDEEVASGEIEGCDLFERTDPGVLRGATVLTTMKEVFLQCLVGGACFIVVTFPMLRALIIWYSVTPGSG